MKKVLLGFLALVFITSCSDDSTVAPTPEEMEEMEEMEGGSNITGAIWTGENITFTKADNADPSMEANQDRITDNVWITRGTEGGQIFNIKSEDSATKATSPADTEWAKGTTSDLENLTFDNFRNTIKPQTVVGEALVLHLITDDIYIDIKFASWTASKAGGFSYTRSTE